MRNITKTFWMLCFTSVMFTACDSKPKIPSTPAASVNAVLNGVSNNKPEVIWAAMPKSYQTDVNKIVAKWAGLMEKDTYNSYMKLIKRLGAAVKQKREMIMNTMMKMAPPDKKKQLGPMFDSVVAMIDAISSSQIMDHSKMLNADVGKFISRHGGTLMKSVFVINPAARRNLDQMSSMKFVQASMEGDNAKLNMTKDGKVMGPPLAFVKIEGRWVPSMLQGQWGPGIAKANSTLDNAKAKAADVNKKMLTALPVFEKFVVSFEEVKNEAQLSSFPIRLMALQQQLQGLMK